MFLSVGDILQLSRLAADLYTKGWAVARDAPQDFRDLVHELLLLKDILFVIHSKVSRDPDSYGDPTRRVLQYCFDALSDFSSLVAKYEKLGKLSHNNFSQYLSLSGESYVDSIFLRIVSFERSWSLVSPSTMVKRAEQYPGLSQ